jgi:hypothetical protein
MLTEPQRDYIAKVCLTLQIIVGALAGAVLMFLGIVIFIGSQNPPAAIPDTLIITDAAYSMAANCAVLSFVVPNLAVGRARKSLVAGDGDMSQWRWVQNLPNIEQLGEVAPLAAVYQTRAIIGAAFCQGAAFMACIAYLFEHQRPMLVVAGLLLLLILRYLPTPSRLESWIENELTTIHQMRQLR